MREHNAILIRHKYMYQRAPATLGNNNCNIKTEPHMAADVAGLMIAMLKQVRCQFAMAGSEK